jgi:hypothetical protein
MEDWTDYVLPAAPILAMGIAALIVWWWMLPKKPPRR